MSCKIFTKFNKLKEQLADLTATFSGVEVFVADLRSGRKPDAKGCRFSTSAEEESHSSPEKESFSSNRS